MAIIKLIGLSHSCHQGAGSRLRSSRYRPAEQPGQQQLPWDAASSRTGTPSRGDGAFLVPPASTAPAFCSTPRGEDKTGVRYSSEDVVRKERGSGGHWRSDNETNVAASSFRPGAGRKQGKDNEQVASDGRGQRALEKRKRSHQSAGATSGRSKVRFDSVLGEG